MKPFGCVSTPTFSRPMSFDRGERPTATSSWCAQTSPCSVSTLTPPRAFFAPLTLTPTRQSMPAFLKADSISLEMSSSSSGTRRSRPSSSVTLTPSWLYRVANSTPTAPAPMMQIDSGTLVASVAWSDEMISSPSNSRPGSVLTVDPVATIRFLARSCLAPISIVLRSRSRPLPATTSILFFFIRNWTPL